MQRDTTTYREYREQHQKRFRELNNQHKVVGFLRLITIVAIFVLFYFFLSTQNFLFLPGAGLLMIIFIILLFIHSKTGHQSNLAKAFLDIQKDEINYIEKNELPKESGAEYIDPTHAYSHDLDLFGKNSLFHHINRSTLYSGHEQLAKDLIKPLPSKKIAARQEAIKELKEKIEWRQHFTALGMLTEDNYATQQQLKRWRESKPKPLSPILYILSYILPAVFFVSCFIYFWYSNSIAGNIALYTFLLNIFILTANYKRFKIALDPISKVDKVVKNYSRMIAVAEKEEFNSEKLKSLQKTFKNHGEDPERSIKKLSNLFAQMDNVQNPIGAFLFNGLFMYHFRVYRNLLKMKEEFSEQLPVWVEVLGQFDALNSWANLSYNNPGYTFPKINESYQLDFKDLGHPLINAEKCVSNDINFNEHPFVILTGSNMSGKSTFLRSLGVNMVMARAGAAICASAANIHPLDVYVSMRLTDSLNEDESYFFAEIKRLNQIMQQTQKKKSFVLLDEILRGTNSDDKRSGTIEVIKKLIAQESLGVIATHDLEVCNTANEHPEYIINKTFESQIKDDELYFDYQIRDGICQNKNATFLMKKMGVISQ